MARKKHRDDGILVDEPDEDEDDEEEEEDEDDEESDEADALSRDYVMARLAAARAGAQSVLDAVDETLVLFVNPDEDERGKQRKELLEAALEASGEVSRALEAAQEGIGDMSKEALQMEEPE